MTNEQRKAIDRLKQLKDYSTTYYGSMYFKVEVKADDEMKETIDTVLSMLKEKDKEIEEKDRIIDLMAEFIEKVTVDLKVAFGENMLWNRDEIKQYFERKSKE